MIEPEVVVDPLMLATKMRFVPVETCGPVVAAENTTVAVLPEAVAACARPASVSVCLLLVAFVCAVPRETLNWPLASVTEPVVCV